MNKNGSHWISPARRLAIYLRDRFACAYCGRELRNALPEEVTLDHLLPRSAGGTNEAPNLITACRTCNSQRQEKPWLDYASGGARDRIEQLRHEPLNIELAKAILEDRAGAPEVEAKR